MHKTLLILSFVSSTVFGQRLNENQQINDVALGELMYTVKYNKANNNYKVSGDPYFFPDWVRGSVTTASGNKYSHILLKYDLYSGQLACKKPNGTDSTYVNMELINSFALYSEKADSTFFKRSKLTIEEPSLNRFYQVLYEGKSKLLLDTRRELLQYDSKGSSLVKREDILITKKRLILIKPDLTVNIVKGGAKKFIKYFPKHAASLKGYIDKNKIDVSEYEGKITVIRKYDEIIAGDQ